MLATEDDNKPSPKHVEAAIWVILGRGFNSLRLHWFNGTTTRKLCNQHTLRVFCCLNCLSHALSKKTPLLVPVFVKLELAWAMQLS